MYISHGVIYTNKPYYKRNKAMKKLNIALTIALFATITGHMFGMTYEQYMAEKEFEQQKRKIDEEQQKLRDYEPYQPSYRERETRGPVSIQKIQERAHRSQTRIPTVEEQRRMQEKINRKAALTDYNDIK